MKKNLFLLLITLLCISCSNDTDKAQGLIKDFLKEKEIKGYEPIEFGTLDSAYTKLGALPEFIEAFNNMKDETEKLRKQKSELEIAIIPLQLGFATKSNLADYEKIKEKVDATINEMNKYQNEVDSIEANFVPTFNGYSLAHKFKVEELGDSIQESTFFFDETLTEVIGVEYENSYINIK